MGGWWGLNGGQDSGFKFFSVGVHQANLLLASQAFELAKMKGNLQHTQHRRAVQPLTAIPINQASIGHQTAHTDRHCSSEKQPTKADHCSLF